VQPLDNRLALQVRVLLLRLVWLVQVLAYRLVFQELHNKPQVRVHYSVLTVV
jgi:hypothetical protein